jgi:Fe-S-cluster containining protein
VNILEDRLYVTVDIIQNLGGICKTMLDETKKSKLCLQCMECCKILAVPIEHISPDTIEFYVARGCWLAPLSGGRRGVVIPFPCLHLTPEGCDIYSSRPYACEVYDGTKDPLMSDKCLWIKKNRRKK